MWSKETMISLDLGACYATCPCWQQLNLSSFYEKYIIFHQTSTEFNILHQKQNMFSLETYLFLLCGLFTVIYW